MASDRRDDPKLGKMSADGVDHRGLLADEQVPGTVQCQAALLLWRLVATNRMFGLVTASQIASASTASFLCRKRHVQMTTQHLNHFGVVQGLMQINHRVDHAGHCFCWHEELKINDRTPASLRPQDVTNIRGNPGSIARRIMTSNWTSLFVAGSLLFVTTQIAAEEHAVLGQGNVSCGSWLNDRKGEDAASSRIAWVLGYVTGFNQYGSKPEGDVSGGKGTEEIMTWIDNYCGRHPDDNLYSASAALVDELRQKLGR